MIKGIMKEFDSDENGNLDFKEAKKFFGRLFQTIFYEKKKKQSHIDLIWAVIENDTDRNKKLDLGEIKVLCKKLCSEKIKELKETIKKHEKELSDSIEAHKKKRAE